jgi:calcineurin-like phosphoesterase family protein
MITRNFIKKIYTRKGKPEPIFIECRLWGRPRDYFKDLNRKLTNYGSEIIKVPHMALYGESTTTNLDEIKNIIENVSKQFDDLVSFETNNFSYFDLPDKKWNIIRINPSPELEALRLQMAQLLIKRKIAPPKSYDRDANYRFHISIGKTKSARYFATMREHVKTWKRPDMSLYLLRITIIGDVHGDSQKIKCEYDLLLNKWLTRKEALSKHCYRETMEEFRKKLGLPEIPEKRQSFWSKIFCFYRNIIGKKNIYLISDTHFDHANIIKYCNRPFRSVSQMDKTIVDNWNETVKENDTVYFLGDWSYGTGSRPAPYWMKRLNGQIISIKGSHDKEGKPRVDLKSKKHTFKLVHDPKDRHNWEGWIIHGHVHNKYPFIKGKTKTINVSVDVIGYKPIRLDTIESYIDSIKCMETYVRDKP